MYSNAWFPLVRCDKFLEMKNNRQVPGSLNFYSDFLIFFSNSFIKDYKTIKSHHIRWNLPSKSFTIPATFWSKVDSDAALLPVDLTGNVNIIEKLVGKWEGKWKSGQGKDLKKSEHVHNKTNRKLNFKILWIYSFAKSSCL